MLETRDLRLDINFTYREKSVAFTASAQILLKASYTSRKAVNLSTGHQ